MSHFNKLTEKSVRIVLPLDLYNELKERCIDYGDISRVVRHLLRRWIKEGGTVRAAYDEATEAAVKSAKDLIEKAKEINDSDLTSQDRVDILKARVRALEILLEASKGAVGKDSNSNEPTR
jgi:hypothetical protein